MGWSIYIIHIRMIKENKAVFIKKIKTIIIDLVFGLSRRNNTFRNIPKRKKRKKSKG